MYVRKRTLGEAYVVGAGVAIGLGLLAHAGTATARGPVAVVLVAAGLVPAAALAGARFWLPRTGLSGRQLWTVAVWCGLGIGLLTLVAVAVLASGAAAGPLAPIALAASVAIGAGAGVTVGSLLALRRAMDRLERTNDVLARVLRHNLGNDLIVILGHLDELESEVPGTAGERVRRLQQKVDEVLTTTEKARQIDLALSADDGARTPVDLVPYVERAVRAVDRSHPEATVTLAHPERCHVWADWLLATVVNNVVENAAAHAEGPPEVHVTLRRVGDEVELSVVDDCPTLPPNERAAIEGGVETPLEHSTGVGLSLVQLLVEEYGGTARVQPVVDGGNELVIRLPRARHDASRAVLRSRLVPLRRRLAELREAISRR